MQWLPKKNANLLNSNEMGKVAIRMNGFFTVSASVGRMSQLGQKRKLTMKSITEKYIILTEVDKGNSCASVAKKHNIPKQTLSNWLKKKKQIYESVDSNSTREKRQRFRGSPYETLTKLATNGWYMQEAEASLYQTLYSKQKPSTLQKNLDAMISVHQMVGWTDGRKGKT